MPLHDLMNPDDLDNPFPLYSKLHQQGPLISAEDNIISSGSHAVVESLLNDRRDGKNHMRASGCGLVTPPPGCRFFRASAECCWL